MRYPEVAFVVKKIKKHLLVVTAKRHHATLGTDCAKLNHIAHDAGRVFSTVNQITQ
ncbi:MAG: hypothetical protein WKF84_21755 [Pyrinomonadaceae bacterium]